MLMAHFPMLKLFFIGSAFYTHWNRRQQKVLLPTSLTCSLCLDCPKFCSRKMVESLWMQQSWSSNKCDLSWLLCMGCRGIHKVRGQLNEQMVMLISRSQSWWMRQETPCGPLVFNLFSCTRIVPQTGAFGCYHMKCLLGCNLCLVWLPQCTLQWKKDLGHLNSQNTKEGHNGAYPEPLLMITMFNVNLHFPPRNRSRRQQLLEGREWGDVAVHLPRRASHPAAVAKRVATCAKATATTPTHVATRSKSVMLVYVVNAMTKCFMSFYEVFSVIIINRSGISGDASHSQFYLSFPILLGSSGNALNGLNREISKNATNTYNGGRLHTSRDVGGAGWKRRDV